MTCYQRHLAQVFTELDLTYDQATRGRVHRATLGLLGLPPDAPCPVVWAALKQQYGPVEVNSPRLARDLAGLVEPE